jgi:hypothetical protein
MLSLSIPLVWRERLTSGQAGAESSLDIFRITGSFAKRLRLHPSQSPDDPIVLSGVRNHGLVVLHDMR